ncbi:MAG: GNAT family N-acetyltransferase [Pseudomonadota bacterium]
MDIINRDNITSIAKNEWDILSEKSIIKNPFYEFWCLIPALKWLETGAEIMIVTLRIKHQLIGLFPIKLEQKLVFFSIISFWKHKHCFLTTPLTSVPVSWSEVNKQLLKRLNANLIYINTHDPILSLENIPHYRRSYFRPAVSHPKTWQEYEKTLPRKRKSEYRRITRRLFKKSNVNYIPDINNNLQAQMASFIDIEDSGWKGIYGSALSKNPSEAKYYFNVVENAESQAKILYSAIEINGKPIAISFGFKTGEYFFEVKTAYSESYRKLYPGVVLELKNLSNYAKHNYYEVDSCTNPDNVLISQMWPDKKNIINTWIFRSHLSCFIFSLSYPILRKLLALIKKTAIYK